MEQTIRMQIGDVPIDAVTMAAALARVESHLLSDTRGQYIISGVNAHFINVARRQKRLKRFLSENHLNVADGISVVLAARLLGGRLPERLTGIDLMVELCGVANRTGRSVYLLGGMPGAAVGAARALQDRFPGLNIVGVDRPPVGREFDRLVVEQIRDRIRHARPDFLFVCFGVPRQEYWIEENTSDLPIRVAMGNGAAFDVLAGLFHRPSRAIQKAGMEWFYRLCVEPGRLWRRYLLGNLQFAGMILQQSVMKKDAG